MCEVPEEGGSPVQSDAPAEQALPPPAKPRPAVAAVRPAAVPAKEIPIAPAQVRCARPHPPLRRFAWGANAGTARQVASAVPPPESPGTATAVFKDMVAALGEEGTPRPAATPPAAAAGGLTDMDMMLADLAFAARPPPVITPDEGTLGEVRRRLRWRP